MEIRATLERLDAGQREVVRRLQALEQQQEQQKQQAELSQPFSSTLPAYNDAKTLQTCIPVISPLQTSPEEFVKRAPRLMDYVRICKPGVYDNMEGVVFGSSLGLWYTAQGVNPAQPPAVRQPLRHEPDSHLQA